MNAKLYTVKMTVELVVSADNEFAAETEAKDQIGLLRNQNVLRVVTVKPLKYIGVS